MANSSLYLIFLNLYSLIPKHMVKKLLSLVLLVTWITVVQAQSTDESPVIPPSDETPVVSPVDVMPEKPSVDKKSFTEKLDYNLSAGTSFISAKNFGSGTSTYVAPEISYKLSPKVRLNVGIMFLNSNFTINKYKYISGQSEVVKTRPSSLTLAYVEGDYLINDRLSVSGMVMKDLSGNQYGKYYNPIQAMSLNMNYKLSDHITIGAGVHVNQGTSWGYPAYNYDLLPVNGFSPFMGY